MESMLSDNAVVMINSVMFGYTIISIIVHWLCDFVFQKSSLDTDTESDYKRNHCIYYALSFTPIILALGLLAGCHWESLAAFIAVCVVSHTVVDYGLIPVLFKCKELLSLRMLGLAWALDQIIHIFFIMTGLVLFIV